MTDDVVMCSFVSLH